jgi:uncharacterized Tic20 family protein
MSIDATAHPDVDRPATQEWERTYAMFLHLTLLAYWMGFLVLPALALWLIKREQSRFIDDHGKDAINFQLTLIIYGLIAFVLGFITCSLGWIIGFPLLCILALIGMVLGARAAQKGEYFRYPMTLRFLR